MILGFYRAACDSHKRDGLGFKKRSLLASSHRPGWRRTKQGWMARAPATQTGTVDSKWHIMEAASCDKSRVCAPLPVAEHAGDGGGHQADWR